MKLSEAILLGSTLSPQAAGRFDLGSFALAATAIGVGIWVERRRRR